MGNTRILVSFVGNHDPWPDFGIAGPVGDRRDGPILSLLSERDFDEAVLLCTSPDYLERARQVEAERKVDASAPRFVPMMVTIPDVVDYRGIFLAVSGVLETLAERYAHRDPEWSLLLDPGTPQMQTVSVLLVRTGRFPATLLQGIPPWFNEGVYAVREVDFPEDLDGKPVGVVAPGPAVPADSAAEPREAKEGSAPPAGAVEEEEEIDLAARLDAAGIIVEDEAMRETFRTARKIAEHEEVIPLILGETGTGKSLLAEWIHKASRRAAGPLAEINCATIRKDTAESQLFGHVKGAFTGADHDRPGSIRSAEGGTLFLDEIGELSIDLQAKLLHVIEGKPFRPMGSDRDVTADVRIIAATNRDLEADVTAGEFRQDLFQRIDGIRLTVLPLQERPRDLRRLLDAAVSDWNRKNGTAKTLTDEARETLLAYRWPGNIRELEKVVVAAALMAPGDVVTKDHLPGKVTAADADADACEILLPEAGINLKAYLVGIERDLFRQALERAGGVGEKAAGLLGMKGPTFRKALRERHPELLNDATDDPSEANAP